MICVNLLHLFLYMLQVCTVCTLTLLSRVQYSDWKGFSCVSPVLERPFFREAVGSPCWAGMFCPDRHHWNSPPADQWEEPGSPGWWGLEEEFSKRRCSTEQHWPTVWRAAGCFSRESCVYTAWSGRSRLSLVVHRVLLLKLQTSLSHGEWKCS